MTAVYLISVAWGGTSAFTSRCNVKLLKNARSSPSQWRACTSNQTMAGGPVWRARSTTGARPWALIGIISGAENGGTRFRVYDQADASFITRVQALPSNPCLAAGFFCPLGTVCTTNSTHATCSKPTPPSTTTIKTSTTRTTLTKDFGDCYNYHQQLIGKGSCGRDHSVVNYDFLTRQECARFCCNHGYSLPLVIIHNPVAGYCVCQRGDIPCETSSTSGNANVYWIAKSPTPTLPSTKTKTTTKSRTTSTSRTSSTSKTSTTVTETTTSTTTYTEVYASLTWSFRM